MGLGDKATRNKAIPFQCHPFEIEPHAPPATYLDGMELLRYPEDTSDLGKIIRMTLPQYGDITELYLFLQMVAPIDKTLSVRLGIGKFNTNSELPDNTFTYDYVQNIHAKIKGSQTPYSATAGNTLTIEANLLPFVPRFGQTGYSKDGFVLIVYFDSLPDTANDYQLIKFNVFGSSQMGLT